MWAMRCIHEASLYEDQCGSCFITLTYDDDNVPEGWTLVKKDFQDFMKRLRKYFPQKIKFYMCGEYGNKCMHLPTYSDLTVDACDLCSVGRPHYHAILFNCSFHDLVPVGQERDRVYNSSPTLERIWNKGFVEVGEATFESCAYVARYVTKKVTGVLADDHYLRIDNFGVCSWVEPEYNSMSRGARKGARGIGAGWYEKYKTDVFPSDEVPVPGSGVYKKVPRYYDALLESEDPVALEEIKERRLKFKEEHGDEYSPGRLMAKYKVKKAQYKMLKRNLN